MRAGTDYTPKADTEARAGERKTRINQKWKAELGREIEKAGHGAAGKNKVREPGGNCGSRLGRAI